MLSFDLPVIYSSLKQRICSEFLGARWAYKASLLQQCAVSFISKKNTELRRRELLEAISSPLLEYLQEHTQEVVIDKSTFVLVADILRTALGDIQPALDAIANLAAEELVPGGHDGQVM